MEVEDAWRLEDAGLGQAGRAGGPGRRTRRAQHARTHARGLLGGRDPLPPLCTPSPFPSGECVLARLGTPSPRAEVACAARHGSVKVSEAGRRHVVCSCVRLLRRCPLL